MVMSVQFTPTSIIHEGAALDIFAAELGELVEGELPAPASNRRADTDEICRRSRELAGALNQAAAHAARRYGRLVAR